MSRGAAGLDATPAEIVAFWDMAATMWSSLGSPWRVSRGDAEVYARLAGAKLGGHVLVLGVTPDLRDLVAEAGGSSVVADVSAAMYESANGLLRRADPSGEAWINGDWCEAPLTAGEFDLVLGDLIMWALPLARQLVLLERIRAALDPDGLFVSRFRFTDVERSTDDPALVVGEYLDRLDRAGDERQALDGELMSWLYDHTENRELRRLDKERAHELMLNLAERPKFARRKEFLLGYAARLVGPDWTSQSREDLLELVRASFRTVGEAHASGYESSQYPILALQPV